MDAQIAILGLGTCGLALLGLPLMFLRRPGTALAGILLAVPFIAFMVGLAWTMPR